MPCWGSGSRLSTPHLNVGSSQSQATIAFLNLGICRQGALSNIQDGRWTPEQWSDIRCDDDYERFYQSQAESGRKLPPPLDSRTVYAQLPPHLQQQLTQQQQQQALAARLSPAPPGPMPSFDDYEIQRCFCQAHAAL